MGGRRIVGHRYLKGEIEKKIWREKLHFLGMGREGNTGGEHHKDDRKSYRETLFYVYLWRHR